MAGPEDSESKRILKPGDFNLRTSPLHEALSAINTEKIMFQPSILSRNPSAYHQSISHVEQAFALCQQAGDEGNFNVAAYFPGHTNRVKQQSSLPCVALDNRSAPKPENQSPSYSRSAPALRSHQKLDFSAPSSPESEECRTDRKPRPIYNCNTASTQTERSPFEEKFLFRESVLVGCDLIAELTEKIPPLSGLREHAQFIREKTIQSRAQNVCSRVVHKAKEPQIIAEYVKTFFRISDAWLDVRNCFGTSDQCSNEACNLDTRDLTRNYVEWMHVSRQLLGSIVKGLERATNGDSSDRIASEAIQDLRATGIKGVEPITWPQRSASDVSCAGGTWGYPTSSGTCYGGPTPEENRPRNHGQPHMYPTQTPAAYNHSQLHMYDNGNTDYLKPSSYDVPHSNVSHSQKRSNISKARATCFEDKPAVRGYVINLINGGNKREDFGSNGRAECIDQQIDETSSVTDSDSQSSTKDRRSEGSFGRSSANNFKSLRNTPQKYMKLRLSQNDIMLMQALVQELSKCDVPDHVKYPVKNAQQYYKVVRHPIFIETMTNKLKNGTYETLEQFVHDGRRLVGNALLYCEKESVDYKKALEFEKKFEGLLSDSFDRYANWAHITGDSREVNSLPELRSTNVAKKRSKITKIFQNGDSKLC